MRFAITSLLAVMLLAGVEAAAAGTVAGSITVTVRTRAPRPARYHRGPYRSGRDKEPRVEGATAAVVWIEGSQLGPVRPIEPPPLMHQKNETFLPRVLAVTVGTSVEFPNEDGFYHNVFSVASAGRFDLGRYAQGKSAEQTFVAPGVVVVRCEIHTAMKAYILVLETPYYTVPDAGGNFSIPDLPAGEYTVKAWHPNGQEQSLSLVVPGSGTVEADFHF